jgi:iron-sulfur cluster assembly protein
VLTLTEEAVTAVRNLTTQPDLPEETGLRIASAVAADGAQALSLSVASEPQPADQVVEEQGARVFVDPEVAPVLEDKALDADLDAQGAVQFRLADQSP